MLHIELDISDIDYDTIVEKYLPVLTDALRQSGSSVAMLISNGMSSSMARKIIDGLSPFIIMIIYIFRII